MSESGPALTDDQWSRIRQIVHDEALRARVAASFLPLYGPLPSDATTVSPDSLTIVGAGGNQQLVVDDFHTIRLASVAVNVTVKNHMLADPELAAASILFKRAADIVARVEDAVIFRGRTSANNPPIPGTGNLPTVFTISGSNYRGLIDLAPQQIDLPVGSNGPAIFTAVVGAVNALETEAYYKPFACVLSNDLFQQIYTPIPNSMVLPADSIPPVTNGPLLRSSTLADGTGVVISLQGNPVEIVVGHDIHARYLQGTPDGDHLFRVSQRFVLRVKDVKAVVRIAPPVAAAPPAAAPHPAE
jgi:uncharacterized linocin/CFP29 family protein